MRPQSSLSSFQTVTRMHVHDIFLSFEMIERLSCDKRFMLVWEKHSVRRTLSDGELFAPLPHVKSYSLHLEM